MADTEMTFQKKQIEITTRLLIIFSTPLLLIGAVLIWQIDSIPLSCLYTAFLCIAFMQFSRHFIDLDFFSPFLFFSALFLIGFAVRPLILDLYLQDFYRSDWGLNADEYRELSLRALLYSQIGYIAFFLGFHLPFFNHRKFTTRCFEDPHSLLVFITILSIIGLGAYAFYIKLSGLSFTDFLVQSVNIDKGGKYILFALSWMFVLSNVALFYYRRLHKTLKWNLIYAAHFMVSVIITLSFHDRKWIVLFLCSLVIIHNYTVSRIQLRYLFIFSGAMFMVLMMTLTLRNMLYGEGSLDQLDRFSWEFIQNQLLLGGMLGYFDYFARLLYTLEDQPTMLWYNLKFFGLSFFPQGVLTPLGIEKLLPVNQWLPINLWEKGTTARAPGISIFGDLYAMGKLPGITLGLFFIGLYFRTIYHYLICRNISIRKIIAYILFFQAYFIIVRSVFFASTVTFLLPLTIYLFALGLMKLFTAAALTKNRTTKGTAN